MWSILFLTLLNYPNFENLFSSIQARIAAIKDIDSLNELALFSFLAIIGVFTEEMIWRGIILQKLRLFFSDKRSVIISAVLFAFSHFMFVKINIGYFFYIFFVVFFMVLHI